MGTNAGPPASAGAAFFTGGRVGLWAHVTERLSGRLHDIKAAGFDYLVLKVADSDHAYHHAALTSLLADIATAQLDMPIAAWAYVKPDDPEGDAKAICDALPAGVLDIVLDAEIEWENAPTKYGAADAIARVHRLCRYIIAHKPKARLHLSSFWSPKLHASLPFRAFMLHCDTWQPQAYSEPGSRPVALIADGAIAEGRTLVSEQKRTLVLTINSTAFLPILKSKGIRECNVYAWDAGEGDAQVAVHLAAWADAIKVFRS